MVETAAEVLIRTARRWYNIQHLNPVLRKKLMALPETEFKVELEKLSRASVLR
jgi:hypothetical protein